MAARFLTAPVRAAHGWGTVDVDHNYRHVDDAGVVSNATSLPDMATKNVVPFRSDLAYVAHTSAGLEVVSFDENAASLSRSDVLPSSMLMGAAVAWEEPYLDIAFSELSVPELRTVRYDATNGWSSVSKQATNYMIPIAMEGPIDVWNSVGGPGYPNGILRAGPQWSGVPEFNGYVVDAYTPVDGDGSIALVGNNHAVWKITTTDASELFAYDGHVGIAWTGAFWELAVSDASGKVEERRLDTALSTTSATQVDTTIVPTALHVGADRDRALIVVSSDCETDLIQVCY